MTAPREVIDLIERFERNHDIYRSHNYNETETRREFIDPLFKALGWDIDNQQGYAEAYKDVVHEATLKVTATTEAPDYAFRIGGMRKFFVEAKRPGVDIKNNPDPAYQLRRYAWSAKLPLSILTDFEEFAVYDGRIRPNRADKASAARVLYIPYTEYEARWDEIAAIFSREAILKGSFDKYVESSKKKRGTAEVDDAFLKEIENWRDLLARNIALRNPDLSTRELNYAVQRTIDRIIFLRICEDRGVESYGQLMALQSGTRAYERLCQIFRHADERYNSGLFHFTKEKDRNDLPDDLTLGLTIDDKILKDIFKGLYYPESPFEFSVLPADILGHIYEQFLGKVIRLTSGHHAKVEDKPEVKKAGGVYYTPTYIVDYIVKNTVGKLLEGKTPNQIAKLCVLDPACGSGSFLLGAYQYLLDWHQEWYQEHDPQKHAKGRSPKLYQGRGGEWRLTTAEKKRILLNNIYGVDIDTQAVEVTKLSLLLKVLEGENAETLGKTYRLFHERALPDLGDNIKCGNSLIGPDFYEDKQLSLLDDEERYRINAFDWEAEFPEVFVSSPAGRGQGEGNGFDAVIGNPPYGGVISLAEHNYFKAQYKYQDAEDLYLLFLERYHYLLKQDALLGIIVSNTWLQSVTYRKIRIFLTTRFRWQRILYLPRKVFHAVVDTHVLIFQEHPFDPHDKGTFEVDIFQTSKVVSWHRLPWLNVPRNGDPINVVASYEEQSLFAKINSSSISLSDIFPVFNGIKPFEKGKGQPPQTVQTMRDKPFVKEGPRPAPDWSPLLRGSLIQRYWNLWNGDYWILYGPWLAAPRDPSIFSEPEVIVVRQTGDSIIATLVEHGFYARNNLHIILPRNKEYNLRFVLGILNSRLCDFVYSYINPERGEALAEVKKKHVEQLPIRAINFSNPTDKARHDRMVELVETILKLHKQLDAAKTTHEKTAIQRQIDATDKQIDQLVYKLYGLTKDEIAVIKGLQSTVLSKRS